MRKFLALRWVALLSVIMFTVGCPAIALMGVGAAGAIGTYKWMEGVMEKDYPRPFAETWQATLTTVEHFRWKIVEKKSDPMSGKLVAVAPDNTEIKITVTAQQNSITTVGIRYGWMGNKEASALFHQQIMKELGLQ